MTLPAATEPAFIVNSQLAQDTECAPEDLSNPKLLLSPGSRSTSTGSSSPLPTTPEGEIAYGGLPDYEYPVPLCVRNTFIDASIPRPISLDEFFEERRVHSCPVETPTYFGSEVEAAGIPGGPEPFAAGSPMVGSVWAATAAAYAAAAAATRCLMQPMMSPSPGHAMPIPPQCTETQAPILRLADAIAEPELGSPAMWTMGSEGHHLGICKPCAFFYTKGCGNGSECPFCHLCPEGEKKRRQKMKGTVDRQMRRMGCLVEA